MYGSWTLLRAASRRSSAPELSHEGFLFHREVVENSCQTKFRKEIPGSWLMLASFPGSCAWVEKKEPGTHCLRMLSSPRISGNFGNFRKTCPLY